MSFHVEPHKFYHCTCKWHNRDNAVKDEVNNNAILSDKWGTQFAPVKLSKVYACLTVTCHLHFWQNDRGLLRAAAVTRGWNGYRNNSQHRKLTLEKKILPPLLQGFEPATFRSRVRRSNHWVIPAPSISSKQEHFLLHIIFKTKYYLPRFFFFFLFFFLFFLLFFSFHFFITVHLNGTIQIMPLRMKTTTMQLCLINGAHSLHLSNLNG